MLKKNKTRKYYPALFPFSFFSDRETEPPRGAALLGTGMHTAPVGGGVYGRPAGGFSGLLVNR